ncbi:hypothetical protein BDP55DRAFT_724046 [Colletotrichum godetiae]|uniref:Uncharacterized protein n=1 Tax=Colletotrichum godetiae TaxID=1209918 RepID=A0AAJ0EXU5_9PEZI|nr:uncharacterized protein BDP55DRAFT_724046 [Colletotrichum godetiae]KAK1691464.1 hypothetical protein BDP55DRAFT_724046 [Colletotrichum godetiae]
MSSLNTPNFDAPRPKSSRAGSDASSISADSDTFTHRRAVSTDCPRPSKRNSQFLFGGRSLTDMARSVFKKD